jgi:hypothetical protein
MATCQTCGNDYDKAFVVTTYDGVSATFDSIECAAEGIAPSCAHCGCRILGHGVESDSQMFCCASCATTAGVKGLADRAPSPA